LTEFACIPESHKNVVWASCDAYGETLTDLQILGCEFHQNAFGGRTRWGSYSAPLDSLAEIRGRQGREGKQKRRDGRRGMEGETRERR